MMFFLNTSAIIKPGNLQTLLSYQRLLDSLKTDSLKVLR